MFDRASQSGDGNIDGCGVEMPIGDFCAQPGKHGTGSVGDSGVAFVRCQSHDFRLTQQIVHRRQLAV